MIAKTTSIIPLGFSAAEIKVEGAKNNGLPSFNIVGMGSRTISEARERVKSAIKSSGFSFPSQKLVINLAPADLEKDGSLLDLPIAINVLILAGELQQKDIEGCAFVGELSLDGSLNPVRGIINIVEAAKKLGIHDLFIPVKNFTQAKIISGVHLIPANTLSDIFLHLKKQLVISPPPNVVKNTYTDINTTDLPFPTLDQIKGQAIAKRALSIAVAGRHNILLSGPPGTGKTMLAKSSLGLLPPLDITEQISITKLHSLAGTTTHIIKDRPFRMPHHTSSLASLIGGGAKATPGEISLAHLGVLFLDELPEYPRSHLESLRQPLEDHEVTISRAKTKVVYPTDFMLIATMNPCPCGYLGDPSHSCTCTNTRIANYQRKLSGPLLDRIDLFVEVKRPKASDLLSNSSPSASLCHDVVKNTVTDAIAIQHQRYQDQHTFNSYASARSITENFSLSKSAESLLNSASSRLNLSARSYFKLIKVARTIADLEKSNSILDSHIAEALTYRRKN